MSRPPEQPIPRPPHSLRRRRHILRPPPIAPAGHATAVEVVKYLVEDCPRKNEFADGKGVGVGVGVGVAVGDDRDRPPGGKLPQKILHRFSVAVALGLLLEVLWPGGEGIKSVNLADEAVEVGAPDGAVEAARPPARACLRRS